MAKPTIPLQLYAAVRWDMCRGGDPPAACSLETGDLYDFFAN